MEEELLFGFRRVESEAARKAEELFKQAYDRQAQGALDEAIRLYTRSIELWPTAEAYTFRGWAQSFQGKAEEAIEDCKRAIHTDPDFGNPYNDIGAYLIEMGRPEEAIPWLKQAMKAPRYQPRHFPHVNLARVHILLGRLDEALAELKESLRIQPNDPSALSQLKRLRTKMN
jgi:Tfp pilus assembly protein PilF